MNCFFCQNECRKENDEGRWSCSHHAVTVHLRRYDYHEGDGLPDFLYFTHDHKDKEYTVWFIFRPYDSGSYKEPNYVSCHIDYYPHNFNADGRLIQFDFIPNLTPDNFLQKLPTILVFL